MLKTTIYLDNAATTKVSDNVLNAMLPYLKEEYGNPSSIYTLGRNSAIAVNKARHQVAQALGSQERGLRGNIPPRLLKRYSKG